MKKWAFLILCASIVSLFLFGAGSVSAATISMYDDLGLWENNRDPYGNGTPYMYVPLGTEFKIDICINDDGELENVDMWNLGIQLTPGNGVTIAGADNNVINSDNYIFYGDSYDHQYNLLDDTHIVIGDTSDSGSGKTFDGQKLLATLIVNVTDEAGDGIFDIDLFGPLSWTFIGDNKLNLENIDLNHTPYQFTTTPIPTALWLFGSGLIAIIGLRRKHV